VWRNVATGLLVLLVGSFCFYLTAVSVKSVVRTMKLAPLKSTGVFMDGRQVPRRSIVVVPEQGALPMYILNPVLQNKSVYIEASGTLTVYFVSDWPQITPSCTSKNQSPIIHLYYLGQHHGQWSLLGMRGIRGYWEDNPFSSATSKLYTIRAKINDINPRAVDLLKPSDRPDLVAITNPFPPPG